MARLNTDMVCTVATYFYEGVMLLLPVLCLVTSPCSGQEDTGSQPTRCVSLNNTISDLPGFCRRYYDDSEHLNGNIESDLQAQILIEINGIFQNDSYSLNLCIELIENYLCYYYFPLCNQTTGEITPVCKSSCTLLVNNADCFELIKITNWKLSQSNSLTIGNCLQTFRNYGSAPAVSENCLSIEDSLNESIPLICIEIQSKEICRRQLENSFYAPGTLDSTRQVFNEFQEIIRQLVDSCKDFISTLNCVLRFPACNETRGTIFPICHNICDFIDLTVNQCTSQELFRNNPEFSAVNQFLDTFECREPQSYYNFPAQYIETDPNICSGFYSLNELIPLICIEIPSDETCLPQLQNSFYSPGTLDSTHQVYSEFQEIIRQLDPLNFCRAFISTLICVFRFPACNETRGTILPICHNICDVIDLLFNQCTSQLFFRNNPEFPAVNQFLDTFECREPQSYYNVPAQYIETDPNICSGFLMDPPAISPMPTTPTEDSENPSTGISGMTVGVVIGGTGFFIIIAIICIICAICLKRNFKHKSQREISMLKLPSIQSPYKFSSGTNQHKSGYFHKHKEPTADIKQLLQHVETKFSDVLIPAQQIVTQEYLGKGAFGLVHKGELKGLDGMKSAIAIKTIKFFNLNSMEELVSEIATMKLFDHPNVLQLLGVCVDTNDDDMLRAVLPYMANGNLRNFLKQRRVDPTNITEYAKGTDEELLLKMCLDIAKGMEYLSGKRFVHRDLAARNCMVDDQYNIKVADFGLTRDVYTTEYYRSDKPTKLPVKWMSPESLMDQHFDEKSDVWSYGITCWEIFSLGSTPYPGVDNSEMITFLKVGKRLEKPVLCQEKLFTLIQSTWLEKASDRPSFATIVTTLSQGDLHIIIRAENFN